MEEPEELTTVEDRVLTRLEVLPDTEVVAEPEDLVTLDDEAEPVLDVALVSTVLESLVMEELIALDPIVLESAVGPIVPGSREVSVDLLVSVTLRVGIAVPQAPLLTPSHFKSALICCWLNCCSRDGN